MADKAPGYSAIFSTIPGLRPGTSAKKASLRNSHSQPSSGRQEERLPSNRNRLLASLRAEELSALSNHLREVPIKQGELLEERGERVDAVHFPQSGMVSLIVEMPEDRSVEIGTVGSEGAIGLTVGLGSRIACVSALVQVSGTSLCIPAQRFRGLASESRHITDLVVRYNEMQLGQIQQTAACNALHDVGSRLARWLLQTNDKTGDETIPFTQEFLSKMLGVRRGTVSVVATRFEATKLIRTGRGQIQILDREGLKKEACSCYEYIARHVDRLLPRS
jgi:CRP-like cAMP-binding protein